MVRVSTEHDRFLENLCPYIVHQQGGVIQVAWLDMDRDMIVGQRELIYILGEWIQINLS